MIGIDLLEIPRMQRAMGNAAFMRRVFTEREAARIGGKAQTAAGIFCAKEAVGKALGTGILGIDLRLIEITHEPSGKPNVTLHPPLAGNIQISITHTATTAAAVAVLSEESPKYA